MKPSDGSPKAVQWVCFYLKRHFPTSGKNKKTGGSKKRTDRRYRKFWYELIDLYGMTENYNTDHSKNKRWIQWLRICELAGIIPEAHRAFKNLNMKFKPKDRKAKYQKLIDLYNEHQARYS